MRHFNTLVLILMVSVFIMFAAFSSADDEVTPGTRNGPLFVDEDGDGVCDNKGTGYSGRHGQGKNYRNNFVDEDGDGICDNFVDEDGDGICDNFVDEDGDGVCDNYVGGKKQGGGRNRGKR